MGTGPTTRLTLVATACFAVVGSVPTTAAAGEVCIGHAPPAGASPEATVAGGSEPEGVSSSDDDDGAWVGGLSGLSFAPELHRPSAGEEAPVHEVYFWCAGDNETGCFPHRAPSENPPTWQTRPPELGLDPTRVPEGRGGELPTIFGATALLGPGEGVARRLERPPR